MMTATMTSWQENHHQNERILMKLLMRTPILPGLILSARETLGFNPNLQPVCRVTPCARWQAVEIPGVCGFAVHLLARRQRPNGYSCRTWTCFSRDTLQETTVFTSVYHPNLKGGTNRSRKRPPGMCFSNYTNMFGFPPPVISVAGVIYLPSRP